ncbi:TonB-dependent receptor domain-containing protein [Brevundimonas guildfordensis]|uniref:TonB-dependent receptor n=1 Tax=Brevundimonas guildfordensis TaxID=2762241 RepID=A0ABR8R2I5_9CAUL|nr:TonB-dependent receptor [Brevundimonas guildfordensis]MBD7941968.1 TonB-dependent receptor [Brevundimonas guildfordensis]
MNRRYLFGTTVLAGVVALSAPAMAQTTQPEEQVSQVEEIVVTGSRIRRDPVTAPTPLIQVTRETLLTTGQNTVIDHLATIPALMNSQVPSDTTAGVLNAGGLSLPNLRSLGSGRTLTLVDGRRHVGSQQGTLAVDVDTIPRLLIESIEIVTGGASSVYGADAVSGVLNFKLRKDFDGLEIDTRWAQLNDGGQTSERVSVLAGKNFFDDRLNVYGFAEYERLDEVLASDIDWLGDAWGLVTRDTDTAAQPYDGITDTKLYRDRRSLQLMKWGQVTLANNYQPSALNNPYVIPTGQCTATSITSASCFGVAPGRTYVFDGPNARLADFGNWVQVNGTNRVTNVGGDGENPNTTFNVDSTLPQSENARFQVGLNFKITPNINLYAEAKYVDETTNLATGYSFGDIYISDALNPNNSMQILATSAYTTRTDNAFLPANLAAAIRNNRTPVYGSATSSAPGEVVGDTEAPFARYSAWLLDRPQTNEKQLQRYVVGLNGHAGDFGFVKNIDWDLGYTFGRLDNLNIERGLDIERFSYAMDAVRDASGNIVCRVQMLTAGVDPVTGLPRTVTNRNPNVGGTLTAQSSVVQQCKPLNVFGAGNQSAEALEYVRAQLQIEQVNEQHDALGSVSGQLWDFWGAGRIGVALGAEYRKEYTEGLGRSRSLGTTYAQLNTGGDFLPAEYETKEVFAEISIPLMRDSFLGEYAELSGSYRYSDFSTFGSSDVYGVNFVYRPIRDIAFKTSFNTSVRAPTLGETNAPFTQTFLLFTDPCATLNIQNMADREKAANRVVNCAALASQQGLTFNFTDPTASNAYRPDYGSSVPGRAGGNPFLQPEESESFTFSTVLQPRFIPNFSVVLDYYEITIDKVIAAVTAQVAAENCVNGPSLNASACATLFRTGTDDPATPRDDRFLLVDFIQSSINYAKRNVRGMDFTTNYSFDTEEMLGRNWGRFTHSLNGSWLIEQKNFNNIEDPADFTEVSSNLYYPRVRFSSTLAWRTPIEGLRLSWIADWQTAQDIVRERDFVQNADQREIRYMDTGNFVRHDFSVRYEVRDDVSVTATVQNAFDAEQARWLGGTLYSNFDPYGRRFSINVNYRPW